MSSRFLNSCSTAPATSKPNFIHTHKHSSKIYLNLISPASPPAANAPQNRCSEPHPGLRDEPLISTAAHTHGILGFHQEQEEFPPSSSLAVHHEVRSHCEVTSIHAFSREQNGTFSPMVKTRFPSDWTEVPPTRGGHVNHSTPPGGGAS